MSDPVSKPLGRGEEPDAVLGANLVAARLALGWTQDALSAASRISRATIAQLETGSSDPRLSTVAALARSMGVPPSLLLLGAVEIRALSQLQQTKMGPPLSARDVRLLKEAAREFAVGRGDSSVRRIADAATAEAGGNPLSLILAILFAAVVPDPGLTVGAAVGRLIVHDSGQASAP